MQRVPLLVTGNDSQVLMEPIGSEVADDADSRRSLALRSEEVRMLSAQVVLMRHELRDSRAEFTRQMAILKRQIARMNNSVTRFVNRPAFPTQRSRGVVGGSRQGMQTSTSERSTQEQEGIEEGQVIAEGNGNLNLAVGGGGPSTAVGQPGRSHATPTESVPTASAIRAAARERGEIGRHRAIETLEVVRNPVRISRNAQLSKCPKSLHDLWKEYVFGFSGNKPAKDFTAKERGAVKHVYSKRNVFWTTVSELIRAGWTADRAIEKIYHVYGGRTSVTNILKILAKDKRAGGHPELRVRTA